MAPSVHVLTTGGTIASTGGDRGATPTIDVATLVDDLPELAAHASLSVEQVDRRLSFQRDFDAVASLARRARSALADGADAVVVTHGTDTMDESAYYLDLALDADAPIVFTGAQRRADAVGADGPANLLAAVRAATADLVADAGGAYVAFDEELHAARRVVKAHTHRLDAFASPGAGPVATLSPTGFQFHRSPGSESIGVPSLETGGAAVVTLASGLGAGDDGLAAVLDRVDGIVLQGTGIGNVAPALADVATGAIDRGVPVVITSRCHRGPVAPVYGTAGGGKTLADAGVLSGADLPAHKARVKLALALAAVGGEADGGEADGGEADGGEADSGGADGGDVDGAGDGDRDATRVEALREYFPSPGTG